MKKSAYILFSLIIILVVIFGSIIISIHNHKGFVSLANMNAKTHYQYFNNKQIDLSKYTTLSSEKEYYICGECSDFSSYIAYSGDVFNEKTLIYGSEEKKPNGYWAIKIKAGNIVASWASNYPLKKNQLIPYTIEEQEQQADLFDNSKNIKIIGYYDNES